MTLTYAILTILWLSLMAYALLGGADFGGGIWDFFAFGPQAQRQRRLIGQALGPVWEANHVWLIFLIVGLFTAFPAAFSVLSTALFLPLTLALIGIVLRGAAFTFRAHAAEAVTLRKVWGRIFSTASTVTPFLLGTSAAAVASGQIRPQGGQVQTELWTGWTTPFALAIGAMALSLCAVLSAIYLTIEAQNSNDMELVEAFRRRALIAGTLTVGLNVLGFMLSPFEAPLFMERVARTRSSSRHHYSTARTGDGHRIVAEAVSPGACSDRARHSRHGWHLGCVAISLPDPS